jgi:hypothetical protein
MPEIYEDEVPNPKQPSASNETCRGSATRKQRHPDEAAAIMAFWEDEATFSFDILAGEVQVVWSSSLGG